jgi:hypothetical protein
MTVDIDDPKLNEQMMQASSAYWAVQSRIKLQNGIFSFKDHEFQKEPISSSPKRKCYMKSAQSFGATELEVLDDLHGMIYGEYPAGVAHLLPTDTQVQDFGKSRINLIIDSNKSAIGKFVKSGGRGTDTASLKKIRDGFLYLRSGRLSQKIGDTDEDTSSSTAGFPVDKVVFDEVDFMDSAVIEKYKGRMAHSKVQREVYLGNPSQDDFGIDKIFKQSDQRYWHRKCTCGAWTCAELSFPSCVKIRPNGTGYIGCDKCGKEVAIWSGEGTGQWVAKYPEKSNYMYGYHLSQLTTVFNDPAEILADFVNPPNGNLADIYRQRLGRAYSNKEDKLRISDILACCGKDISPVSHTGPCAMGVDVGIIKHAVIGIRIGDNPPRYELLRTCKVKSFNDVYDLAKRYNVKSDVIDKMPYEDEARQYQKNSGHKTFLNQYQDNYAREYDFNDNTGVVKSDRTSIFDSGHRLLMGGYIRLPRQSPEVEEFARQCCNCAKFEEKDKRRGTVVYRYRPTGDEQEHFRNAFNYFLLAASGHRIKTISPHKEYGKGELQYVTNDKEKYI